MIISSGWCQENTGNRTVMIPMRDGIELATDLYFPAKGSGPFPVILMRTPYGKAILKGYGDFFSMFGYVLAAQDVRGRFGSQGEWEPFINEGEDGYDTVEWLAVQAWSAGKIGMYGGSYSGSAQFAAAILKPPHLVTIIPNITPAMPFDNMPYEGGVLVMGPDIRWIDIVENAKTPEAIGQKVRESFTLNWEELLNVLPVIDLDRKILGKENPYWRRWVMYNSDHTYWENVHYLEALKELDIPVFLQSGWFDPGNRGTYLAYVALKQSKNPHIKMIMGPWPHTDQSSKYLYGQYMGEEADLDLFDRYRKWFDYWLKGEKNDILDEPLVKVFNMGPNHWFDANTYPLPGTVFKKLYFTSGKGANTSQGDGRLLFHTESSESSYDTYTYDPGDPSPCFFTYLKKRATEAYMELAATRMDMLVYQTGPLEKPVTIAGPVSVKLYASSSAMDTDWCVLLCGINEKDGIYPIGQTWGVIRARFRNSMKAPGFLEKDKIYEYTIDLSHTGITFSPGERIRVEISSAFFPEYVRNLNTGGHNGMETEYISATQKIYHTEAYPSHLILPVVESSDQE
jgi:putative CocE/NonD family hydrolase